MASRSYEPRLQHNHSPDDFEAIPGTTVDLGALEEDGMDAGEEPMLSCRLRSCYSPRTRTCHRAWFLPKLPFKAVESPGRLDSQYAPNLRRRDTGM